MSREYPITRRNHLRDRVEVRMNAFCKKILDIFYPVLYILHISLSNKVVFC